MTGQGLAMTGEAGNESPPYIWVGRHFICRRHEASSPFPWRELEGGGYNKLI